MYTVGLHIITQSPLGAVHYYHPVQEITEQHPSDNTNDWLSSISYVLSRLSMTAQYNKETSSHYKEIGTVQYDLQLNQPLSKNSFKWKVVINEQIKGGTGGCCSNVLMLVPNKKHFKHQHNNIAASTCCRHQHRIVLPSLLFALDFLSFFSSLQKPVFLSRPKLEKKKKKRIIQQWNLTLDFILHFSRRGFSQSTVHS